MYKSRVTTFEHANLRNHLIDFNELIVNLSSLVQIRDGYLVDISIKSP